MYDQTKIQEYFIFYRLGCKFYNKNKKYKGAKEQLKKQCIFVTFVLSFDVLN